MPPACYQQVRGSLLRRIPPVSDARAKISAMRKLVAVAALGLCLLASGCSAPGPKASTPEPPASTTPTATTTPEQAFIVDFRSENPGAERGSDELWLSIGEAACTALDSASPAQLTQTLIESGKMTDAKEAASLVVLSTIHLCPEHAPQ